MGNNNQEPMSHRIQGGLFAADGPLYLWHDFMDVAINQPWDWNNHAPVPNLDFAVPPGVVFADVCRFSGMSPPNCGGPTINMPFLEGTVPPPDNVHHADQWHPDGCFDIVLYVQQAGRPANWVAAAAGWADKYNNGAYATSGSRYAIGQVPGRGGYGAPICGPLTAPTPTPEPSGPGCPFPPPFCPTPTPRSEAPATVAGTPVDAAVLVPVFALPLAAGLVPYFVRLARRRH
jgi:hypothetical protein